ncbi:PQQ-dependent sugar dehydrogenase [Nocardioides sp. HDW12B]|uniref:PQQ-dependent sugar dehydrogenase n=1 Tax=Nocardioides sp. HDW12B TaxID=2714939 RepID=UPI00140912A5|nr:PQQ-dependent sugar dehydrogenase [Nocardioides sp. HDW12B]QIK68161.1 PQQ-dependent sugar dehydrogenase [Nocardioides sp. HDW12B]
MLDRRTLLTTTAGAAAVTAAGSLLGAAPAVAAPRRGAVLARGLDIPWGLTFLPNGDALVTERENARVSRVRRGGGLVSVGRIEGVDLSDDAGEGGLLGCVVSPTFREDREVFFYLTTPTDNRVIAMRFVGGGLQDRRTVLAGIPRARTHNGGRLAFGPDGLLYATTGDTREPSTSQNTSSLAGKILRMQRDGSPAAGNPFGNQVWSYGHRNVQGVAWDADGRMWATEFGEQRTDELNRIRSGGNYGWPGTEGRGGPAGTIDPFVTWSLTGTCSPSGLAVARGRAWVGALAGQSLYSVVLAGPDEGRIRRHFRGDVGRIRTVVTAPDGSLWITTANGGNDRVIRVLL